LGSRGLALIPSAFSVIVPVAMPIYSMGIISIIVMVRVMSAVVVVHAFQ
jgi:hypothetical protein